MTPGARQRLVWGGLVATLAAVAGVNALPEEGPVEWPNEQANAQANKRQSSVPGITRPAAAQPTPRGPWPDAPAAALVAWGQPPPPDGLPVAAAVAEPVEPAASAAPPPPSLPPYRWIGRIEEDGRNRALLAGATRTLLMGDGEVIDGQWRIDRVGERGLDLTWLPGQVAQRLGPAS